MILCYCSWQSMMFLEASNAVMMFTHPPHFTPVERTARVHVCEPSLQWEVVVVVRGEWWCG
jgi:hypothetical protein